MNIKPLRSISRTPLSPFNNRKHPLPHLTTAFKKLAGHQTRWNRSNVTAVEALPLSI